MKILLVNKFHYLKGGSEKYYFELGQLLKEKGHEVAYFSMQDEKNIKTNCKEYFVEPIDLNTGSKLKALDVIYSKKNKEKMEQALEEFKPDIVHLNNFQRQLSASIIEPIKKRNIPIVYTAHDVQAICPAILMLDSNKNICEKCKGGKYINCIKGKCVKNSGLKSILGAIEGRYYRNKKIYTKQIDKIITPSKFYKTKMIEDEISKEKIEALHNFINIEEYNIKTQDKGYGVYVGRLSKEKGIFNLLESIKKIENAKFKIAGTGPEEKEIKSYIKENKLKDKVELLGFLDKEKVKELISNSTFVVTPSIWYENCPYSVMETLAIGKPVIGANIGGIPELVKNEVNGLTYEFNNVEELASKMKQLFENEKLSKEYGKKAKQMATELYSQEEYYKEIINIYESLIKEKKNG